MQMTLAQWNAVDSSPVKIDSFPHQFTSIFPGSPEIEEFFQFSFQSVVTVDRILDTVRFTFVGVLIFPLQKVIL